MSGFGGEADIQELAAPNLAAAVPAALLLADPAHAVVVPSDPPHAAAVASDPVLADSAHDAPDLVAIVAACPFVLPPDFHLPYSRTAQKSGYFLAQWTSRTVIPSKNMLSES